MQQQPHHQQPRQRRPRTGFKASAVAEAADSSHLSGKTAPLPLVSSSSSSSASFPLVSSSSASSLPSSLIGGAETERQSSERATTDAEVKYVFIFETSE